MRPPIRLPACRLPLSLRSVRHASTRPPPPPPSPKIEPTIFASKSQPREVHYRPESQRGMPDPSAPRPQWETLHRAGMAKRSLEEEGGEAFAGPSKPRVMYERPGGRELPMISSRLPWFIALGLLGMGVWGAFILQATNAERLASSVLRQVNFQLRNSNDVRELLGDGIRLEPNWLGIGEPWISGSINMMQGRVDLSFRIIGSKGMRWNRLFHVDSTSAGRSVADRTIQSHR
ncbi:cytochrome oxidase complex assembly protein 1-domain-containing protein [Dioszegia hungarica]|uniref:Cytochrome oxidase complex assembly protein 1-domain-containing protein n=1 Tax=Dioszegia hungarica TaxID=4972 RepID=A0AA38H4M5_9TREE|nr:cytochrome oxidase complex assembly protein 1-domain-containing protein [Dioszegia hungarica]KAI9632559.1 cytochrome oxidase complex assembly protein 1-domain-containing protein [Dioszegia hungarica]